MNIKVPLFDIPEKVFESLDIETILWTFNDMAGLGLIDPPFREFAVRFSLRAVTVTAVKVDALSNDKKLNSEEDLEKEVLDAWGNQIILLKYDSFKRDKAGISFTSEFEFIQDKNGKQNDILERLSVDTLDAMSNAIYNILIVLLATKNIDRKVVINSARSGSKRARDDAKNYSSTTYLNIGKITETCNGGSSGNRSGGPTRPHLRRGHIRLQRYGEGLKESKQIFIQPTFVNADKEWIDRQKTYKFTGSHDASASSGLTASRETRREKLSITSVDNKSRPRRKT